MQRALLYCPLRAMQNKRRRFLCLTPCRSFLKQNQCEKSLRNSRALIIVRRTSNRDGPALLPSGSSNLCVMYLYGRTSNKDNATICRRSNICIAVYFQQERIYTLHDGGLDSIVLHYLLFTSQISGKNQTMRTPSVHPVLSTCQGEDPSQSPLSCFVSLSDSFGCSWIVGLAVLQECIVLEMKTWNLLLPLQVNMESKFLCLEEPKEKDMPNLISKELLVGSKFVLFPQSSPSLHSLSADSIEGQPKLHEYFRNFHEYYAEYAYKVYFELKHHGTILKRIIDDQHARLGDAQQRLSQVEDKQSKLEDRIDSAIQMHNLLGERLKRLRNLPGPVQS